MSKCCENCFGDFFLIEYIKSKGTVDSCDFCGSSDKQCLQVQSSELIELFSPFFDFYTPVEDVLSPEELKEYQGMHIWEIIQSEWSVFSDSTDSKKLLTEIATSLGYDAAKDSLLTEFVLNETEYSKKDNQEEDSITAWQLFAKELKVQNRFFPSKVIDRGKLDHLFQSLGKEIRLTDNVKFYRARNSHRREKHLPENMGMPPPEKTLNGRANPVGIPYLYLASDQYTAVAEIRPFINDRVTVGCFELKEDLRLVDLRDVSPFQFYRDEDFDDSINQIGYLRTLGSDLSKPVKPRDAALEYLPTQYLCEHIKDRGLDGVIYKSSLGTGYNIAVFEEKLKRVSTELFRLTETRTQYRFVSCST